MPDPLGGAGRAASTGRAAPKPQMSADRKAFWHSPYTNADANRLFEMAKYDQVKGFNNKRVQFATVEQAKEFIGKAVRQKKEDTLLKPLGITRKTDSQDEEMRAFRSAGFTAADVKLAKQKLDFLSDATDLGVKGYMGLKVMNGPAGMDILREIGITNGPAGTDPTSQPEGGEPAVNWVAEIKRMGFTDADVRTVIAKSPWMAQYPAAEQTKLAAESIGYKAKNGYQDQLTSYYGLTLPAGLGNSGGWTP